MRQNVFNKLWACLLSIWYLFAISGFDIHVCSDNGRVYIEPLIAGISCKTIHPDTPCHACSCGYCEDGGDCCNGHLEDDKTCSCGHCEDDEDCCSDTVKMLSLTGCTGGFLSSPAALCFLPVHYAEYTPTREGCPVRSLHSPAAKDPPRTNLSRLCVLRV